jgi:inhibitor of cysteine peptidase
MGSFFCVGKKFFVTLLKLKTYTTTKQEKEHGFFFSHWLFFSIVYLYFIFLCMNKTVSFLGHLGLVASVVMTAWVPSGVYVAEAEVVAVFSDVEDSHPYSEPIYFLRSKGLIDGYGGANGEFRPQNRVNRAEFLKMLIEAADPEYREATPMAGCFPDVKSEWFAPYVCIGAELNIVEGYPDGNFKPAEFITFVEAAKMVVETFEVLDERVPTSAVWYEKYVKSLEGEVAIPSSVASFDQDLTRGESAAMIGAVMTVTEDQFSGRAFDGVLEDADSAFNLKMNGSYEALDTGLTEFASCDAMEAQLDASGNYYGGPVIMRGPGVMLPGGVMMEALSADMTPMVAAKSSNTQDAMFAGAESDEFSTTNVQVQGVDEGDTVKNDGKYIYMIDEDGSVVVVEAYPAVGMEAVARIEKKDFRASSLYITDDKKMIVVGEQHYPPAGYTGEPMPITIMDDDMVVDSMERDLMLNPMAGYMEGPLSEEDVEDMKMSIWPGPTPQNFQPSKTAVYVYDMKNAAQPKLVNQVEYDGYLNTSRRIDGMLYLVLNQSMQYTYGHLPMPYVKNGAVPAQEKKALYVPEFTSNGVTQKMAECDEIQYMPGFIDRNYTMIAAMDVENYKTEPTFDVFLGNPNTVYMSGDNLYMGVNHSPNEWFGDWNGNGGQKTRIYKFELDGKEVEYDGYGVVEGSMLNQFALDENDGHLRVATTVWNGNSMNNVYVLDEGMQLVGEIEDIAPGERIFSTRFLGDRLYMVTFEQVDPLFAIDLKDPKNPKILGKLKIPGYSDYLHPYDANHLLGFGKSGNDEGQIGGMKVALFDVTDPTNPTEKFNLEIGDRGTESELLYNHKAILFDKARNLLAFPVTVRELSEKDKNDEDAQWKWGATTFDGAHVYSLDMQDGFAKKGEISHYTEEDMLKAGDNFPQNYKRQIQRIVSIADVLYGVSRSAVTAHDMNDIEEWSRVELKDLN